MRAIVAVVFAVPGLFEGVGVENALAPAVEDLDFEVFYVGEGGAPAVVVGIFIGTKGIGHVEQWRLYEFYFIGETLGIASS